MGCNTSVPPEHKPLITNTQTKLKSPSVTRSNSDRDKDVSKIDCESILSSSGSLPIPEKFKQWFPPQHGHTKIRRLFQWQGELGHGVTGSVHEVIYKSQVCAVKQVERNDQWGRMLFETEAQVLSRLSHRGIIKCIDMFFDKKYYYLVLEKADYDLYYVMSKKGYLSERKSKNIVYSLLEALAYLHRKNLAHRDLKPENIVFVSSDTNHPRLIDFGDAELARKDKKYTEFVGTPPYMSPERLDEHWGWQLKKADIWAIGVIAYEMFCGRRCFVGETQTEVFRRILRGEWSWPSDRVPTDDFKDFVEQCLKLDAKDRPSAKQALLHRCFESQHKQEAAQKVTENKSNLQEMEEERANDVIEEEDNANMYKTQRTVSMRLKDITAIPLFDNLASMVQSNPLQDILVKGFVETMKDDDLAPYQRQFDTLDVDKDGKITGPDLVTAFTANGIGPHQASALASILLSLLDRNRKGKITFKQFLAARFKYDLSNKPREIFNNIVAVSLSNLHGATEKAKQVQAGFETDYSHTSMSSRSPSPVRKICEEEPLKAEKIPYAGKGISTDDVVIFSKSHSNLDVDRDVLKETFSKYDKDGDGILTYDDFAQALQITAVGEATVDIPIDDGAAEHMQPQSS